MCVIAAAVYFFTHPLDKPELLAPEGVILRTMVSSRRFPWALLVSGACHGAFLALALVPRTASSSEPAMAPDHWTDSSAGAVTELLPAELLEAPSESAPSAPSPASSPSEPSAASTPAAAAEAFVPPAPRPVAKADRPAPRKVDEPKPAPRKEEPRTAKSEPAPGERKAAKSEPLKTDETSDRASDERTEKSDEARQAEAPRRPLHRLPIVRVERHPIARQGVRQAAEKAADSGMASPSSQGAAGASESSGGTTSAGASVGQVGAPTVRDFGMSFTRAIGPAGQPDKAWASLPLGPVGVAEIAVDISAEGKIEGVTPLGKDPSEPLVKLSRQVVAILRTGFFALRGPDPTAGRQVLRLTATTSDVPTSVQGGAAEIRFGYSVGRGTSTFTQSQGRQVDVKVELLRVEPR